MPPASAALSFGGVPDAETESLLGKLEGEFASEFKSAGLHSVSAIDPPHGILEALVEDYGVFDSNDFLYSDSQLAACIGTSNKPSAEDVQKYLTALCLVSAKFAWNAGEPVLSAHKSRVGARVLKLTNWALSQTADSNQADDSDDPISAASQDSCEKAWLKKYGEPILPSQLASSSVLGRIHRGINGGGAFPLIDLRKVVKQDSTASHDSNPGYVLEGAQRGNLAVKRKERTSKVGCMSDFFEHLSVLLTSIAFCAVNSPAPTDAWSGDPRFGEVQGVRLQFSRAGKAFYMQFWRTVLRGVQDRHVDKVVQVEMAMRRTWINNFRSKVSLESCMRSSIVNETGAAKFEIEVLRRKGDHFQPSGPASPFRPAGSGGGSGGSTTRNGGAGARQLGYDTELTTAQTLADGTRVCKPYNDGRVCAFANTPGGCRFKHVCDVVLVGGGVCGGQHKRIEHRSLEARGEAQLHKPKRQAQQPAGGNPQQAGARAAEGGE